MGYLGDVAVDSVYVFVFLKKEHGGYVNVDVVNFFDDDDDVAMLLLLLLLVLLLLFKLLLLLLLLLMGGSVDEGVMDGVFVRVGSI